MCSSSFYLGKQKEGCDKNSVNWSANLIAERWLLVLKRRFTPPPTPQQWRERDRPFDDIGIEIALPNDDSNHLFYLKKGCHPWKHSNTQKISSTNLKKTNECHFSDRSSLKPYLHTVIGTGQLISMPLKISKYTILYPARFQVLSFLKSITHIWRYIWLKMFGVFFAENMKKRLLLRLYSQFVVCPL